jgi:hypothetical protein
MKKLLCYSLFLMLIGLLPACGDTQHPASAGSTIKAVIKQTSLTAGLNVAGITLAITIPAGVSPLLKADGTVDSAATVEITTSSPQNQALPGATFTPATATAPRQLTVSAIVASGFATTDAITIYLNVAPGTFPVESDFNLLSFEAFDTNGVPVTGLTPILTATIQ